MVRPKNKNTFVMQGDMMVFSGAPDPEIFKLVHHLITWCLLTFQKLGC